MEFQVGNGGVGKSSMIQRYCKGIYTRDYKKTIGVDFLERMIEWAIKLLMELNSLMNSLCSIDSEDVRVMLWVRTSGNLPRPLTITFFFIGHSWSRRVRCNHEGLLPRCSSMCANVQYNRPMFVRGGERLEEESGEWVWRNSDGFSPKQNWFNGSSCGVIVSNLFLAEVQGL